MSQLVAEWTFWACLLLVAHTYVLYPAGLLAGYLVLGLRRDLRALRPLRQRSDALPDDTATWPAVAVVIPASNEERHLHQTLANLERLDYPRDRLEVIVVSDGSTDGTNAILAAIDDPRVRALYLSARGGKANALNHGVALARAEILVFTDAATLLAPDAVRRLVRHFDDPRVGVVCGVVEFEATAESRQTEGVYWTYECALRVMEGRLGLTLTASGALYALRRACYRPLATDVLIEDLIVPMTARSLGYRVVYEPTARAVDFAASTVAGEFARRVRVAMGSFRALRHLAWVPLEPLTAFAFFSHKVLRWVLPFLLTGLLASNAMLWAEPHYRPALFVQAAFYVWAALGFLFRRRMQGVRFAMMAYYLVAIHLAYLVGLVRLLSGREATWRRAA